MRWPRPRFTVRRLMVAVALAALVLGASQWVATMRAWSAAYQGRAIAFEMSTARIGSFVSLPDGRTFDRYEDENDRIQDAHAGRMAEKYWHLAVYPWLQVEPDPPRPPLLDHPKSAFDLPPKEISFETEWTPRPGPPAWTFLWTRPWHRW